MFSLSLSLDLDLFRSNVCDCLCSPLRRDADEFCGRGQAITVGVPPAKSMRQSGPRSVGATGPLCGSGASDTCGSQALSGALVKKSRASGGTRHLFSLGSGSDSATGLDARLGRGEGRDGQGHALRDVVQRHGLGRAASRDARARRDGRPASASPTALPAHGSRGVAAATSGSADAGAPRTCVRETLIGRMPMRSHVHQ